MVARPLAALARRRNGKPMHPRGAVFDAVLERHGSDLPWGVPFLDATARDDVVVRLSRGAGLPSPLPDLLGLAVRLDGGSGRPVDLLLSTAGRGALTRVVPVLRRDTASVYCSIMAYSSAGGPIRLAALPTGDGVPSDPEPLAASVRRHPLVFVLAAARGFGAWVPFARLVMGGAVGSLDPELRFDAVRHPPPGLVADGPLARFRAPAYAAAQQARDGSRAAAGNSR
jgi:hypothetical protein